MNKQPIEKQINGARMELSETRKAPKGVNDNVNYTLHNLDLMALPPLDVRLCFPEELEKRCYDYLEICMRNEMKPNIAGMALALNMSRCSLLDYINGAQPMPTQNREVLKRYYTLINSLMEDYLLNGKVNPVAGIFISKNNFNYKDAQEFVVNNNTEQIEAPEELIEEAKLLSEAEPKKANLED